MYCLRFLYEFLWRNSISHLNLVGFWGFLPQFNLVDKNSSVFDLKEEEACPIFEGGHAVGQGLDGIKELEKKEKEELCSKAKMA